MQMSRLPNNSHEEIFTSCSRPIHLRLLHSQCNHEILNCSREISSNRDSTSTVTQSLGGGCEGDVDMGNTLILAVYFPPIIGGMVLVIMWGMSSAGSRHTDLPRVR